MPTNYDPGELWASTTQVNTWINSVTMVGHPDQVTIDEAIVGLRPMKKPMGDPLARRVRDCFKVRSPNRLGVEQAEDFFGAQKLVLAHPYPFEDHKSLVGIEVEVENVLAVNPNSTLLVWEMVEDHSLRNNGREFRTLAIPLGYAQHSLEVLFRGLNPDVDFSARTSIHVHQDVRGLQLSELLTLLFTYVCFEPLFFKFAGNNRKTSIYCVPLLQTTLFNQLTNKEHLQHSLAHLGNWWPKYSALNLQPVSSFGTVEYRHLPGTDNIAKILVWLDLISRIKVWAYKNSFDEVMARISDLNTNSQYQSFLNDVFGSAARHLDNSDLLHDMEEGVTAVRNCVIYNEFHNSLKLESGSPLARACGRKPTSEFLTEEQQAAWTTYHAKWWSHEDPDEWYWTVKRRLNDYLTHGGKEGSALLRIVFPKKVA